MHNSFVSLKEVFNTHPRLSGVRNMVRQSEVIEKFSEIFPEFEGMVTPVAVRKKVLMLRAENAALRSELKLNEAAVTKKVNGYFKEERIKSIRFVS
jgi:hypothetical protein